MKILKMKNFFIAIIVVSVSLVFCGCKEKTGQTEILNNSTVVQDEKGQEISSNGSVVDREKTEELNDFDKGGIENMVHEILYAPSLDYGRNVKRGTVNYPSVRDIDLKNEKNVSRSASDVLKFFRQRTPGLRHVYRKHLKKLPGFQGQITLKFTIISSGEISDISIVSSTTQNREFDTEIQRYVSRWKFHKIKSGKTTVTIPLTFTE